MVDRDNGNGHEGEIEFKHLFNRISCDAWRWGVVLALDMERPEGWPGRTRPHRSWQRVRYDELRGSGIVLGLAWYDL